MLEGTRPFAPPEGTRQSIGELARRIMLEEPPRTRRTDVPRALSQLLARTMAKLPEQRPRSAAEFGQEVQRIQGELGLTVTALPLATTLAPRSQPPVGGQGQAPPSSAETPAADPGSLPPPGAAAHGPPPGDPRVGGRDLDAGHVDHDHDQGNTVTIGREVAPADEPASDDGSEATARRVVLGTVAGVVCLLAVAVSLLVFGRGGGDGSSSTTTGPTTTQLIGLKPPQPQGVTVAPAAEPGSVVVAWQAVGEPGDGTRYQVRPQTDAHAAAEHRPAVADVPGRRRRAPSLLHRRRHLRRRPELRRVHAHLPLTARSPVPLRQALTAYAPRSKGASTSPMSTGGRHHGSSSDVTRHTAGCGGGPLR